MPYRAGSEIRLQLSINGKRIKVLIRVNIRTVDFACRRISVAVDRTVEGMDVGITQVLTHGESIIKLMREAVAHHLLTAGHLIIRFAFVKVRRQLMRLTVGVVIRHHRPLTRQPAVISGIRIALEITQESEVRFVIRTPAKGGGDRVTGRLRHLLLGVLAAAQTGQTI